MNFIYSIHLKFKGKYFRLLFNVIGQDSLLQREGVSQMWKLSFQARKRLGNAKQGNDLAGYRWNLTENSSTANMSELFSCLKN